MIESTGRATRQRFLVQCGIVFAGALLLLWTPALNGYPILHADSGTYIWSSVVFVVPADRPIGYSLILRAMSLAPTLWIVVIVQALGTSYLMFRTASLFLRGTLYRNAWAFAVVLVTILVTSLSTFVGFILADILAGWIFLGTVLFLISPRSFDRVLAGLAITAGVWSHNSHVAIALGLAVLVGLVAVRYQSRRPGLIRTAALWGGVLIFALASLTAINLYLRAGTSLTRGGDTIWLNRLAETGVLRQTLEADCATRAWLLCSSLPLIRAHDREWRWFLFAPDSPIQHVGWTRHPEEQRQILLSAVRCCWRDLVLASLTETWRQGWLLDMQGYFAPLGDEMNAVLAVNKNLAYEYPVFQRSRRQSGVFLPARLVPWTDTLTQLVALALVVPLAVISFRRGDARLGCFLLGALVFLGLNAAVTATFSGAVPRYQARVAWLLPYAACLAIALFASGRLERARSSSG